MNYTQFKLHPSIWRLIRKNHSGLVPFDLKDKNGFVLGQGEISRDTNIIYVQSDVDLKKVSYTKMIEDTNGLYLIPNILVGNNISIGQNYY